MTPVYVGLAIIAGIATWSLAEYCIHRWLGHDRRLMPNPFGAEHTVHHSRGDYFAPAWKKGGTAVLVTGLLGVPAVWLAGWAAGLGYVAGFVGFYLYYEVLHRLEHVHEGWSGYGRWARRHHFYHHFHDPSANHGVTSPVWDVVFGTHARADRIRVPAKLQMQWLADPATGEVWPHLRDRWELRGKRRSSTENGEQLGPGGELPAGAAG